MCCVVYIKLIHNDKIEFGSFCTIGLFVLKKIIFLTRSKITMKKIMMLSFVISSMLLLAKGEKVPLLPTRVTDCQIQCTKRHQERQANCESMYGPNGSYPNNAYYVRCLEISEHYFQMCLKLCEGNE